MSVQKNLSSSAPVLPPKTADAGAAAGKIPAPSVAAAAAPGQNQSNDSGLPAAATPARFGGWKGGKKTKSGFPPGSPEHEQFKKQRDAERKRRERAEEKRNNPPILPSANPAPAAIATPPAADTAQAPLRSVSVQSSVPAGDANPAPLMPPVLWRGEDILPGIEAVTEFFDAKNGSGLLKEAREAKLPPKVLTDLEKALAEDKKVLANLSKTGAALSAKWLNKAGISAEWREEANFAVALASYGAAKKKRNAAIRATIKAAKEFDAQTPQQTQQQTP